MNNFTYFNDKSAVYVDRSGDDTDDEDWSESSKFKCNPCKKDFSTNGQLKKHNKQHFGLNNSISNGVSTKKASQNMKLKCSQCKTCFRNESERNVHKCNKPTLDNSLLLQEDDDAENITKMPRFVLVCIFKYFSFFNFFKEIMLPALISVNRKAI